MPIKGIWVAVFKTCSNCTGLLPRRACLYHYNMCSSGILLPSAKTYKAWVGHIFLRCGSKSQKLLMSLEGTKTCGSFDPKADKLLAGWEQNPSSQQHFHIKSLVVNCYWVLIETTTLNYALKKQQTKNKQKKIVRETMNFCSPNLTKPKKKYRNTTKCYNIFTVPLFSVVISFGLIYYLIE